MTPHQKIAGVVLAGGQSSRMGENKAFLTYNSKFLIDHMITLLEECGCHSVYISGKIPGYQYVEDPVPHQGPAFAIANILRCLSGKQAVTGYDGFLFVPVDMPDLSVRTLRFLMQHSWQGAYYSGNPLPFFIPSAVLTSTEFSFALCSIYDLLKRLDVPEIALHKDQATEMLNINTKAEWASFLKEKSLKD